MAERLINLITKTLLEKFGAGKHKPGSGSAAAFQGMIAAQLVITVIDLTNEPRRRHRYQNNLAELLHIRQDIHTRLYPALENLFQEDSNLFDKVIKLRQERDNVAKHNDWSLYSEKQAVCYEALRQATELPIQIARNCYELGKYAGVVFDHGFKSARGDAGVGLQGAVAAMASSLQVVDLNLTTLPLDGWMATIRAQRVALKTQYAEIDALGKEKLAILEKINEQRWYLHQIFGKFRQGTLGRTIRSDQDIEVLVREFQNLLWIEREKIWPDGSITNAMQVLNPANVLQKVMGYAYYERESLGTFMLEEEPFEVAGLIDKNQLLVSVSKRFSPEVMRFTAAHELAHLVLHDQPVLHRDRPVDGSSGGTKELVETQADKFAALFLMPTSIVRDAFEEIFGVDKLRINESTVLALGAGSMAELRARSRDARGFATLIAQTERYAEKSFNSLAKIFGVSAATMGIRLLELSLVEY